MTLSTQDRLEIIDLYGRLNHYFDAGEADKWAGLFTPNATFTRRTAGAAPSQEMRGTTELAAYARRRYEESYKRREIRHVVTNIVMASTETGAICKAYAMSIRVGDQQPPQVTLTGRYTDEFAKDGGGWRFQSRTFFVDA